MRLGSGDGRVELCGGGTGPFVGLLGVRGRRWGGGDRFGHFGSDEKGARG
jgi:hypothetical protein